MQKLIFLARVAFICNICFLFTWVMRAMPGLQQGHFASTILVMGLILAIVLNLATTIPFFLQLFRKKINRPFPYWLFITNFLFFLLQLILIPG